MVLRKCFLTILFLIGISHAIPQIPSFDALFEMILRNDCNKGVNGACPVKEPQSLGYKRCGDQRFCVQRRLCQNDEISTDGAGIFEERSGFDTTDECVNLDVCCGLPKKKVEPTITRGNKLENTPVNKPVNTPFNTAVNAPVFLVQSDGCGHRNPDGVAIFRIASKSKHHEAEFGEFPWVIAIMREMFDPVKGSTNHYVCGGALIAPTVVVSAAHCMKNFAANDLIARAGEWDTKSKTEILPDQNRRVSEIILHENFNRASLYNDIALLIVETPYEYSQNVRPICLPPANTNFDHSRCYAAGWGKDKFGREGIYQGILKKIDLPIVPRNQCQTNLRATQLGALFNLHQSFICAGGEAGKDTCEGDGGSPLVCPIEGKTDQFYHAGIVAWGLGCGVENIPAVYANVAHLRPWIDGKLSKMAIDSKHYTA